MAPRTDTTAMRLIPTRALLSAMRAVAELPFVDVLPVLEDPEPVPAVGAADGVKTAVGFAMQELTTELAETVAAAAVLTVPLPPKLQALAVRPLSS